MASVVSGQGKIFGGIFGCTFILANGGDGCEDGRCLDCQEDECFVVHNGIWY